MKGLFLISMILMFSNIGSANRNSVVCEYDWKWLNGMVDVKTNSKGVETNEQCTAKIVVQDTSPCEKKNPSLFVTTHFHCSSGEYQPISAGLSIKGDELWSNWANGVAEYKVGSYTADSIQFFLGCESVEIGNLGFQNSVNFSYEARCVGTPVEVRKKAIGKFAY